MEYLYLKNGAEIAMARPEACNGCGRCTEVCPHAVFRLQDGRARLEQPQYCMECGACARNCAMGVIKVKSGVGCAGAIIYSALGGKGEVCCGPSDKGSGKSKNTCC